MNFTFVDFFSASRTSVSFHSGYYLLLYTSFYHCCCLGTSSIADFHLERSRREAAEPMPTIPVATVSSLGIHDDMMQKDDNDDDDDVDDDDDDDDDHDSMDRVQIKDFVNADIDDDDDDINSPHFDIIPIDESQGI